MANKINAHVERLHRYLPFSSSHDQIYEEYQRTDDALNLETRALEYLARVVEAGAKLVILTGDAGHGKTHLCRRLLEKHFGFSQEQARELINSSCDGSQPISGEGGKRSLRVYKDFSEMTVDVASEHIERTVACDSETIIICANEGRLRAVLEHGRLQAGSGRLLKRFTESFQDGLASSDDEIHIINLNYQSVASNQQQSLVSLALRSWVSGTRWKTCQGCDSREKCPISFNRLQLAAGASGKGSKRLERIDLLFATVERLGAVVTIREILMTIAYLLTGGLRCEDVHKKLRNRKQGWQNRYAFYNSLFTAPPEINRDKLKKIPVLSGFSQLDPGERSIREVDEKLVNEQGVFEENSQDLIFVYRGTGKPINIDAANGIDEIIGNPRNKKERTSEALFVQEIVRSLRRKLFFEEESGSIMSRLGFEYGDEFLEVLNEKLPAPRMKAVKNRIVSGLHTIQGLQMGSREATLHVVDPSFSSTGSHAAIIARRVATTCIKILPMKDAWNISQQDQEHKISTTVDWLDRHIVLRVENEGARPLEFPINLMVFDCIARASSGYVAEEFYAHDLRRVKTFLGSLTRHQVSDDGNISLFIHGKIHSVSIDDGVIQVGGGH